MCTGSRINRAGDGCEKRGSNNGGREGSANPAINTVCVGGRGLEMVLNTCCRLLLLAAAYYLPKGVAPP